MYSPVIHPYIPVHAISCNFNRWEWLVQWDLTRYQWLYRSAENIIRIPQTKKKMPQRLEIAENMARIWSDEHPGKTVFRILLGAFLAGRNDDSANPKLWFDEQKLSGWWFGTFFIFPCIGNNHPNWLISFRGVETTNQLWFQNICPPVSSNVADSTLCIMIVCHKNGWVTVSSDPPGPGGSNRNKQNTHTARFHGFWNGWKMVEIPG